jgi:hypothetical protein
MKRMTLVATLGIVVVFFLAGSAWSMYNPVQGRFMQRDPKGTQLDLVMDDRGTVARNLISPEEAQRDPSREGQYSGGMNVHQYVGSMPTGAVDPDGRVVVILSGWRQPLEKGEPVARAVAYSILQHIVPYDGFGGLLEARTFLVGMGGQGEEDQLRKLWKDFGDRKNRNPCSLEQFVAIGHSDGATAIYRTIMAGTFGKGDWPPAYLGLVDLVRLNYWIDEINHAGSADPASHALLKNKPPKTFVENFWQENGGNVGGKRDLKGRRIDGADANWNMGAAALGLSYAQGSLWPQGVLDHLSIWEYPVLHALLAQSAGEYYERAVKAEVDAGKLRWFRRDGDQW